MKGIRFIYRDALVFAEKAKRSSNYNGFRNKKRIAQFLIDYHEQIDALIDLVQPLGKVTKQYNPSEAQAVY